MPKKKTSVIKRIYERGKEITLPFVKRQRKVVRQGPGHGPGPLKSLTGKIPFASKKPIGQPLPGMSKQAKSAFVDSYDPPFNYGATYLTLMVKDPFWIYSYWEIARSSLEALGREIGQSALESGKIILRMYEVSLIDFNGSNANYYFDIEVGPHTDKWYINLWRDNVSCVGEIGLRTIYGQFYALARSNTAQTPRAGYSGRSEQIWMEVKHEAPLSAYVISRLRTKQYPGQSGPREDVAGKRKKIVYYLSEEDIRFYYARFGSLLREIIGTNLAADLAGVWSRKGKVCFHLEGETDQERQAILSRLPQEHFLRSLILGAPGSLFAGASEQRQPLLPGASDYLHEKIKRKFFFELAAELIVYGRTEPDARVWLGDKTIQLRPDGTFSLRFALPDGRIPLEWTALSADREEKRNINTYVQRTTNYLDTSKD